MAIGFPKKAAPVSDGKALVRVKCSGTVAKRCVGTLALKIDSQTYKAKYSVRKGKRATVAVQLGDSVTQRGGPVTAVVTATTKQPSGGPFKTKRKLQLE